MLPLADNILIAVACPLLPREGADRNFRSRPIAVRRFRAACRRQQAHEAMRHSFNVLGSLSSTRLVRQGSSGISAGI